MSCQKTGHDRQTSWLNYKTHSGKGESQNYIQHAMFWTKIQRYKHSTRFVNGFRLTRERGLKKEKGS